MKKEREQPGISVCRRSSSHVAGREAPHGEQLNAKCLFSFRLFCKRSPPPPTPPTPGGETSRNLHQIRRWHIKNLCHKKGSNCCQRCGSRSSFLPGSFRRSRLLGLVSEGDALSGLLCRGGIWSWWLCDTLGWGIAVSAEQEATGWSMTLFRQACVLRSYGMLPLRSSTPPISTFWLLSNHSCLFLCLQKMTTHTGCSADWPAFWKNYNEGSFISVSKQAGKSLKKEAHPAGCQLTFSVCQDI